MHNVIYKVDGMYLSYWGRDEVRLSSDAKDAEPIDIKYDIEVKNLLLAHKCKNVIREDFCRFDAKKLLEEVRSNMFFDQYDCSEIEDNVWKYSNALAYYIDFKSNRFLDSYDYLESDMKGQYEIDTKLTTDIDCAIISFKYYSKELGSITIRRECDEIILTWKPKEITLGGISNGKEKVKKESNKKD